jgi:hypothetical protein
MRFLFKHTSVSVTTIASTVALLTDFLVPTSLYHWLRNEQKHLA